MRISVDYTLCEGHGQCLMAAPELFDLPDGVGQVVVLDADPPKARGPHKRSRSAEPAAVLEQKSSGERGGGDAVRHPQFVEQ